MLWKLIQTSHICNQMSHKVFHVFVGLYEPLILMYPLNVLNSANTSRDQSQHMVFKGIICAVLDHVNIADIHFRVPQ